MASQTESEVDDDEHVEERDKVKLAIERQINLIRDEIPPGRKFRDVEDLQREVIDKLNAVTK